MNRKSKSLDKKNFTMYNETLYEVQKVVSVKWIKSRQYCLIKWKGYDENYNTWQPKEHITFCYKETPEEEKDDDPEYVQNISLPSRAPHTYHTRAKKITNSDKVINIPEQRQEPTQQDDPHSSQSPSQIPKIRKAPEPTNPQQLSLKRKAENDEQFQAESAQRDSLVYRILCFDEQKKIGKVQLRTGKIAHMEYDTIKKRFPEKYIQYLENLLSSK